jgi:succinate dehydrogenase / fumarate reductase membrane anchor subunit
MVKKLVSDWSLTGSGLRDWLWQRLSAVVLAAYTLVLCAFFFMHPEVDYTQFYAFFSLLWMRIFTLIALLGLVIHAWVGMWTVLTDYIKSASLRFMLEVLVILSLAVFFGWGIEILGRLG